jgi:DNA polymerase-3 subunit alpha
MKELKPTFFPDLIAMNALYRPGPIAYIPSFVKRKNGEEEIIYDLEACEITRILMELPFRAMLCLKTG